MSKKTEPGTDFEKTLAELEQLGIELTRQCQAALDNAQQTVELLTNTQDEDSLKPFDPDA